MQMDSNSSKRRAATKSSAATKFSATEQGGLGTRTPNLQSLLLLAGDIETNPGPPQLRKCAVCDKNIGRNYYSYVWNACKQWVHKKCSSLIPPQQHNRKWICSKSNQQQPSLIQQQQQLPDAESLKILQLNIDGVGNKLTELSQLLERHKIKIAVIQESKLSTRSKDPSIKNYSTVRQDRQRGQGGGLLMFIHESIKFTRTTPTAPPKEDQHLEVQQVIIEQSNSQLSITNVYIPPTSSCDSGYQPSISHLLRGDDALVLGDFNAHHVLWHSVTPDARGNSLADEIDNSNFRSLNTESPIRVPKNGNPSSPDISLASPSLLLPTSWQTVTTMSSDHLPIIITLQTSTPNTRAQHKCYVNLKKANWPDYQQEIERELSKLPLPADAHSGEKIFRKILLNAAKHYISKGRKKLNSQPLPAEIVSLIEERDRVRRVSPAARNLTALNNNITTAIIEWKQERWRSYVESFDHKTSSNKLWHTIKAIDGRKAKTTTNEAIIFNGRAFTSSVVIAKKFNTQYTTVQPHSSDKNTRHIVHSIRKRTSAEVPIFTAEETANVIKSCSNSKAFGPDGLTVLHLKHLGPRALEYLTTIYNDSVRRCRIPAIWEMSTTIPLLKPGKDPSQGKSYRPISLLCPAAKVIEALILPSLNNHLTPADHQHGFRPKRSTTSALLRLTTQIAEGLNQEKPPSRTVAVTVDMSAAFDTVNHNTLLSKISNSALPTPIVRWLSCYIRGRKSRVSFRDVTSSARAVHAGVPPGSKISPALFNYYIADLSTPTDPVKVVSYADDITVFASGPNIPQLATALNNYMNSLTAFLSDHSLNISADKSTVTLFTSDPAQANFHPQVLINDNLLPLARTPKILGVTFDTFFTFHHHTKAVTTKMNKRNNILKALAGTTWGQQKETLTLTYKAISRSIADYAIPIWAASTKKTGFDKRQTSQNTALRIATGCHKMPAVDHLHQEINVLPITNHAELLAAQYLAKCLDDDHPCHYITRRPPPPRAMKETLHSK